MNFQNVATFYSAAAKRLARRAVAAQTGAVFFSLKRKGWRMKPENPSDAV
jgi:hypothetical protein